ncbi:MAG: tetratricopeptide repeat protein [candidate division WOR-3 bacterium]|nr:MAG: tetratricopeptide repeat protein [candidate division WOR-3 bacterium]
MLKGVNIESIIRKLEKDRYSFGLGLTGLFSIITVRNIVESAFEGTQVFGFSPLTENSFYMIFSHFPLFYISLFVWFCLFFVLITGEKPGVVMKPLLIGLSVIVITPFIDIAVSRGSGYKLTYLKGIEEFTQIYRFFDFTRDLIQASWGQRIEIIAVLVGTAIYVWVKTKSVWKVMVSPITAYFIIFIHGVLPNTVAQIPGLLGISRLNYRTIITAGILSIDSQNYSIIFICSIFVFGWWVLKRYDREFARNILRFKKSLFLILATLLGIIYAILLIRPYFPFIFDNSVHYLIFFIALMIVHLVKMASLERRSSTQSIILTISALSAALAIGFMYFFIILSYFLFINYIVPAMKTRTSPPYLWRYLPGAICTILSFIGGFSVIFGQATFACVIPLDRTKIEAYGHELTGWNYFVDGNYGEAVVHFQTSYSLKESNEILKRLGQSYLYIGRSDLGIAVLNAIEPPDYETILSLGQAYVQKGKHESARHLYRNAVTANTEPVEFITLLAQAAARRGSAAEMDSLLRSGEKYGMSRSRFHQIRGDYHLQSSDYTLAMAEYDRALYYDSRSVLAHAGMGMAHYGKGDLVEAERSFSQALIYEPNNDVMHNNLGAISMVRREYDKARNHFERSLKINPLQSEAYYNLGLIAQAFGRNQQAIEMYSEALKINPDFKPARMALDRIRMND